VSNIENKKNYMTNFLLLVHYFINCVILFLLVLPLAIPSLGFASNPSVGIDEAFFNVNSANYAVILQNNYIDDSLPDRQVLIEAAIDNEDSFHLFSHGRSGELFIDGKWLNKEEIAVFMKSHFSLPWRGAHREKVLNIYGCNFAQGENGRKAITYLEKELGIAIAASTNLTGKDGDWVLEVSDIKQKPLTLVYSHNLQIASKHYLPPHVSSIAEMDYEEVVLSTPSTTPISVTITGGGGIPITGSPFTISKGSPVAVVFDPPGGNASPNPPLSVHTDTLGTLLTDAGLILTSTDDYYVNYRSRGGTFQAGSLTSKGDAAPGRNFRWAVPISIDSGDSVHSYISIMAVEDAIVDITGYDPDLVFTRSVANGGDITDDSLSISLLAGESVIYEVSALSPSPAFNSGHIGARINATGNIVVNTGGQDAKFVSLSGSPPTSKDHAIDQLVPVQNLGNEYVVIRGNDTGDIERVIITATADNTSISINGTPTATINDGEFLSLDGSNFSGGTMHIEASQFAYVHHALVGTDGDAPTQGLNFIPPVPDVLSLPSAVDEIAFMGNIETVNFVNTEMTILVATGATVTVEQDGVPIAFSAAQPIVGTTAYEYYNIVGIVENSNYSVFSSSATNISVFGANGLAGFASYFSGFNALISTDLSITKSDDGNGPYSSGDSLVYTIVVTNSVSDAENVVITDTIPGELTRSAVTTTTLGTCDDSGDPAIVCDIGTLGAGLSATVTITTTVN
jgi:uncharacterized repeat protein (TIGR01451 family)